MKTMNVRTGMGYLIDDAGRIRSKYVLPIGEHPIKGKYTYVEVNTKQELDQIQVWQDPNNEVERKIRVEMRNMAIERLKEKGEL